MAFTIYAYMLLLLYGNPSRNRGDAEDFSARLRADGLNDSAIAGFVTHYRQCSEGNRNLFSHKLKWQLRSMQAEKCTLYYCA